MRRSCARHQPAPFQCPANGAGHAFTLRTPAKKSLTSSRQWLERVGDREAASSPHRSPHALPARPGWELSCIWFLQRACNSLAAPSRTGQLAGNFSNMAGQTSLDRLANERRLVVTIDLVPSHRASPNRNRQNQLSCASAGDSRQLPSCYPPEQGAVRASAGNRSNGYRQAHCRKRPWPVLRGSRRRRAHHKL